MLGSWRWLLIVAAMVAAIGFAACNGDGDDNGNGDGNGAPTATEVVGGADGDGDGDGNGGTGGDAFDGVPVPDGADETSSGSFSSSDIPFFVPDPDFDSDAYTTIEFKQYTVDDSPEDVMDFYKDRLSDWDEVFVFSGGAAGDEGGIGVWTKGDRAVWVTTSDVDGETELIVIAGSSE